jgi:uncharacterized coiled-coil DUF342 family protein
LTIDPKDTREKITELDHELAPLKEQRDKLGREALQWLEKRGKVREQIKELRTEISKLKQQRDETNQKVRDLKIIRDQLVSERKEKLAKVVEFKRKLASFKQIPPKTVQNIQNEIETLDWKIQTSSLTIPQEKRIIEQISELEKQLAAFKQTQSMWTEIKTMQHQLRNMRTQEKETHRQIAQLAEESRQIHQTMSEKGANIPKLKADAEEAHEKFIENRREAQKVHLQCVPIMAQIRALLLQTKTEEQKKKARRQTELMQELERKALEKMKRGEKLTWDEFKILAEKGLTEM